MPVGRGFYSRRGIRKPPPKGWWLICIKHKLTNIIRVGFTKQNDTINKPTYAKQTDRKEVYNTHTNSSFVELVSTNIAEEQAQEKRYPLVLHSNAEHSSIDTVCVHICIGIVNNHIGLYRRLFYFLNLTTTVCTNDSGLMNFCVTMFAKFGFFLGNCFGRIFHTLTPYLFEGYIEND